MGVCCVGLTGEGGKYLSIIISLDQILMQSGHQVAKSDAW